MYQRFWIGLLPLKGMEVISSYLKVLRQNDGRMDFG